MTVYKTDEIWERQMDSMKLISESWYSTNSYAGWGTLGEECRLFFISFL